MGNHTGQATQDHARIEALELENAQLKARIGQLERERDRKHSRVEAQTFAVLAGCRVMLDAAREVVVAAEARADALQRALERERERTRTARCAIAKVSENRELRRIAVGQK